MTITESPCLAEVWVSGRPRTKGSLKVYCRKDRAHSIHLEEEVAESKQWRAVVARALRTAQIDSAGRILRFQGAVRVALVFVFPRDLSVSGGPVPSHSTPWPTHITLGDVDKLARNVLDALSMPKKKIHAPVCSGLLMDDSQVVTLAVTKLWADGGREPGVWITVTEVQSPEMILAEKGLPAVLGAVL
jgi:Holliday junction resolvase RusA-like endonuclease